MFTLLAHNCFCPQCARSARGAIPRPGRVCGHYAPRRGWGCVYCGGPVTRYGSLAAALWQSLSNAAGWALWELKLRRMGLGRG